MSSRPWPVVTLRSGRRVRFRAGLVQGDCARFERWVQRQEQRSEWGSHLGLLLSLLFYCDPRAQVVELKRKPTKGGLSNGNQD